MHSLALMLRKDFYCSKIHLGNSLMLFVVMWLVFSLFIGGMAVFYGIIIVYSILVTLFSTEENEQMADINNILPVTHEKRISARYVFAWIVSGAVVLITGLILLVGQNLQRTEVEILPIMIQLMAASLLIINLTFPIIYRVGLQKSRIFVMIVYMVILAISSVMQIGLLKILPDGNSSAMLIMLILLAALMVLSPLSMKLSKKWARRK